MVALQPPTDGNVRGHHGHHHRRERRTRRLHSVLRPRIYRQQYSSTTIRHCNVPCAVLIWHAAERSSTCTVLFCFNGADMKLSLTDGASLRLLYGARRVDRDSSSRCQRILTYSCNPYGESLLKLKACSRAHWSPSAHLSRAATAASKATGSKQPSAICRRARECFSSISAAKLPAKAQTEGQHRSRVSSAGRSWLTAATSLRIVPAAAVSWHAQLQACKAAGWVNCGESLLDLQLQSLWRVPAEAAGARGRSRRLGRGTAGATGARGFETAGRFGETHPARAAAASAAPPPCRPTLRVTTC